MRSALSPSRHGLGLPSPAPGASTIRTTATPAKAPPLKIAWYRTGQVTQFGGGERVLLEGLRVFRDAGVDVRLLLHEPLSPAAEAWFAAARPQVEVVPGFALRDVREQGHRLARLPALFLGRVRSLRRTLARIAPDLIVAESPVEARFLWLYTLGGRLPLPPVVTFIHGSPFQFADDATKYGRAFRSHFADIREADAVYRAAIPPAPPPLSPAEQLRLEFECVALRAGVRMSRNIFVLSEKNRREVERLYGVQSAVVVSPGGFGRDAIRGLDADSSRNVIRSMAGSTRANAPDADRGPVLLSLCRLIAKKRVDLLLGAFRAFLDRNPESRATFFIGGNGPERSTLAALSTTLGLDGRVRFTGFIPERALAAWYRAADVFLSADNADYDLSVMTALAAGRKVVVSTQYDIPAGLVSLRRFFFVAPPTAEGYARTIAQALAIRVAPPGPVDSAELDALTWERYFTAILDHGRRAILSARHPRRAAA